MVRGTGADAGSSTITAMEKLQAQGELAVGTAFPSFTATGPKGNPISLDDYAGQVVLVDFWVSGWKPWVQDLKTLKHLQSTYGDAGFAVIGICMERDVDAGRSFARSNGLGWTQIYGQPELQRQYRVFGEATGFLLDANGTLIGKNLSDAELVNAIKRAVQGL